MSDLDVKAQFKALRETLGMTQDQAAEEFGVQPRSLRRWESPMAPQLPPDAVLEDLEQLVDERMQAILGTLSVTDEYEDLKEVTLPYWSSQDAYNKWHPTSDDDYRCINSISRGVADALRMRDIKVKWLLDRTDAVR